MMSRPHPTGWVLALLALVMLLPVILVRYLPLMDYANHVARFHLLAHHAQLPYFSDYFRVAWQWVPNLGTDIIAQALARYLSTDTIENLIVAIILLVQFGSVVALSQAIHGRSQWSIIFALPFSYSYILMNGFANFLLAQGFMLFGLACWVRLAARNPLYAIMASLPIAFVIFMSQGFAFGLYGLLLGAYEIECWWRQNRTSASSLILRLSRLLPQTLVILPALVYGPLLAAPRADRAAAYGEVWHKSTEAVLTRAIEEAAHRLHLLVHVLDTSHPLMDIALMLILITTAILLLRRGVLTIAPGWSLPLLVVGMAYILMPPALLGVGAVADRMPLLFWLLFAACARFSGPSRRFAFAMSGVFLIVIVSTTISWRRSSFVMERLIADSNFLRPGDTMTTVLETSGRSERAMPLPRCTPMLHHLVWTHNVVTPLFTNGDQQPLAVTPKHIQLFRHELAERRARAMDPQRALKQQYDDDARRGIDYLLVCVDDVPFTAPPPPWAQLIATSYYRIYRNEALPAANKRNSAGPDQQSGSQRHRSAL